MLHYSRAAAFEKFQERVQTVVTLTDPNCNLL